MRPDIAVVAVVTVPDRPAGRGQKITYRPVKDYALENRSDLLQPERLRDQRLYKRSEGTECGYLCGCCLPHAAGSGMEHPALGTFNLHASLLPQYRGAAPINHAIINGETRTGVTTFLIDKEIDTGRILLSRETEILPMTSAGSLHDRLMTSGAGLVIETVKGLYQGILKPVPQSAEPGAILHDAPKILPGDTVIDWKEPVVKIHNKIRGLSPSPGAATTLRSGSKTLRLKLFESRIDSEGTTWLAPVRYSPGLLR